MELLYDYYYRFQDMQLHMPGRCRVRIFKRGVGSHTVLLTELPTNSGASVAGSCERIATDLARTKGLNPKTTRWIQHEISYQDPLAVFLPQDDSPQVFDELQFMWSDDKQASAPQWKQLSEAQAKALTGATLTAMAERMEDAWTETEATTGHDGESEAEGSA